MTTQTKTQPKTPTQLLRADHKKVKALFAKFEKTEDSSEIEQIFLEVSTELKIHTQVEEKHFYPAAEELLDDEEMLAEAWEEHHGVDLLMAEMEALDVHDEEQKKVFCAKFTVLSENVKHHIEEEEEEMFPKFDKTKGDKKELLEQMMEEKENLTEEMRQ